jgi:hypothetical protein
MRIKVTSFHCVRLYRLPGTVGRGFEATGRGSATGRGRSAGELDRTAVPLCGACGSHCGIKRARTAGGNDRTAVKIDRSAV